MKTIKRLGIWAAVVATVLMIPLVLKAPWTTGDFVFAGGVLFGSATVYELVTRNLTNPLHRLVVGGVVAAFIMAVWAWAVA